MPMPKMTMAIIRAGMSRLWRASVMVPRVAARANTTGTNAAAVSRISKKKKKRSAATLSPMITSIRAKVENSSCPSRSEKSAPSKIGPHCRYVS